MVPKRRRPPRLSGGGLGGPKAMEAPSPQRRGPRWSHSEGGPLASAARASVIPKRKRPIPPPLLGRRDRRGVQGGGARPAAPGGGGSTQHLWLKMIPTLR